MPTKREAPGESSGRRTSKPWAPGEEAEARQRITDAAAQGTPYVVVNHDEIELEVLSVTINADKSQIAMTLAVEGRVVRPYATAAVETTVNIVVPADVEGVERDASAV